MSKDLETIGYHDYGGKLTTAMTAHLKYVVNWRASDVRVQLIAPYLVYHRISADGELLQSEEITVGGPTMMHDFTVTRNHSIFLDLPAVLDMEEAMSGGMPIKWSDDYPRDLGLCHGLVKILM